MRNVVHELWTRQQTKVRFVLVGIWNTLFGYLVFVACDFLFERFVSPRYVAYMSAAVISNMLAILNAFLFHKRITFRSTVRGKAVWIEFVRFFSMYVFSMVLGLFMLPFFVEVFGIAPRISAALLIPITTVISYIGHSRFSFRT